MKKGGTLQGNFNILITSLIPCQYKWRKVEGKFGNQSKGRQSYGKILINTYQKT